MPKSGTHKRGLSPAVHNSGLSKATKGGHSQAISHQRTLSPKIGKGKSTPKKGTGGMGNPGGMGKGAGKQVTLRSAAVINTQRRIGPQMFRGGGTVGRR